MHTPPWLDSNIPSTPASAARTASCWEFSSRFDNQALLLKPLHIERLHITIIIRPVWELQSKDEPLITMGSLDIFRSQGMVYVRANQKQNPS